MVLLKKVSVDSYYADDVLLYRGIAEPKEDLSKVQSDIDELERWFLSNT